MGSQISNTAAYLLIAVLHVIILIEQLKLFPSIILAMLSYTDAVVNESNKYYYHQIAGPHDDKTLYFLNII